MKKIIIFFIFIICISQVNAAEVVNVNGVDFEIPSNYSGGVLKPGQYVYENLNVFGILCVDDYIVSNYGYWEDTSDYSEELSIDGRPSMFLTYYNSYSKTNVSHLYFPVNNSIYCICFEGNSLTLEIEEIVRKSPYSNISSNDFYSILDEVEKDYENRQFIDSVNEDNYIYNTQRDSNSNNNRVFLRYFLRR